MLLSDLLCFMRCWKRQGKFCMVDNSFKVSIFLMLFGVNILIMLDICLVACLFGGFLWEMQLAARVINCLNTKNSLLHCMPFLITNWLD